MQMIQQSFHPILNEKIKFSNLIHNFILNYFIIFLDKVNIALPLFCFLK